MINEANTLATLAESRRIQIITAKINTSTNGAISDSFAYAVANSICPAYLEDPNNGPVAYESYEEASRFYRPRWIERINKIYPYFYTYRVSYRQVIDVLSHIEHDFHVTEDTWTFWGLVEEYATKRTHVFKNRLVLLSDIYDICRYLYFHECEIEQKNDREKFWDYFISGARTSSARELDPFSELDPHGLISPLSPDELRLEPSSYEADYYNNSDCFMFKAPRRNRSMKTVTTGSLRKLLKEVLRTDTDLNAYLIDHFIDIKAKCSNGMNTDDKLNMLLEQKDKEQILRALYEHAPEEAEINKGILVRISDDPKR